MKIRNPRFIRMAARLGTWIIRGWVGTVRFEHRHLGPIVQPHQPGLMGRYLYSFWHENLLLPAYHYSRPNVYVLISRHADGQLIAEVAQQLGLQTVRGSTSRGGVEALRNLLRLSREAHLVITPDGPRGPRREVQAGMVYLAARTGIPIVPVGFGYDRPWRTKSWDRFAVPRPWSRGRCVIGEPIFVPTNTSRDRLEGQRLHVQDAMCEVTDLAEQWAETGEWPESRSQRSEVRSQRSEVRSQKPEVRRDIWRAAG